MSISNLDEGPRHSPWTIVVAMTPAGVIGRQGDLPWRLSSDLRRFKRLTMGDCLLMGRKTFDSIGKALPGRQSVVLSRKGGANVPESVSVVSHISDVNAAVLPGKQVMVVGGGQVYQAALPYCQSMWITRVLADVEGDVFFPPVAWEDWQLASSESIPAGPADEWPTEFQIWQRKIHT